MKKREDIIGVLVIRAVPLCSYPINILGVQTMFLEEDDKKKISISHNLKENWNFRFLVV